ncbi:hypothetical protein FA10DRAFT_302238 [Acaromyces ingoldii]|uniref:Uncharacterized protein n=1 Tax=Acaromyces ingoldii TaxID=215250 RepID=A0A316YPI6_9BASI|nr:hypothetical protein FA10DRAFT_302238 [Acaromyces ingoldii]PWN91062.1 hypothetical protein FA10DRAFT_302238 [Acaromyces ingoldii]
MAAGWPGVKEGQVASGDQGLLQNLLAAEWIVDGLYRAGMKTFKASDFVDAGFPTDTYSQLKAVYENENGHLRVFEDAIASTNIKPGRCQYLYGFEDIKNRTLQVQKYMVIVSEIEIGSMAYLTGLAQQAESAETLATIMGTISAETRHLTFVNGQVLRIGSFVGPTDTVYPWPLQILSTTKQLIVPGSCPKQNPEYPSPDQKLPKLSLNTSASDIKRANGTMNIAFAKPSGGDLPPLQRSSPEASNLHAIFFNSLFNYTVKASFLEDGSIFVNMPTLTANNGNLLVAIANTSNVRSKEDIVAGPLQVQLGAVS